MAIFLGGGADGPAPGKREAILRKGEIEMSIGRQEESGGTGASASTSACAGATDGVHLGGDDVPVKEGLRVSTAATCAAVL